MSTLTLATDEDVANRATGDWPLIAPKSQMLAEGADGVFDSSDRWTLISASTDFESQAVAVGNVPIVTLGGTKHIFGVDTVNVDGSLTLRRRGLVSGAGVPPSPLGGLTGVKFSVPTAQSQIAVATFAIQRRYNVLTLDDLQDIHDFREAIVLWTLVDLYTDAARNTGERADDFASKARTYKAELNALFGTLDGHYAENSTGSTSQSAPMTDSDDAPFPFSYFY